MKRAVLLLFVLLVLIQFIHPSRNESGDTTYQLSTKYAVPAPVQSILKTSCYDCHSNRTIYPWYANIQPVAWWLTHHVNEGKEELNFDEFATYRIRRQYHKLEEITKQMDEQEMPLTSYTLIHRHALLSNEQRLLLSEWANSLRDSIKANYPADSLKMPKRD